MNGILPYDGLHPRAQSASTSESATPGLPKCRDSPSSADGNGQNQGPCIGCPSKLKKAYSAEFTLSVIQQQNQESGLIYIYICIYIYTHTHIYRYIYVTASLPTTVQ